MPHGTWRGWMWGRRGTDMLGEVRKVSSSNLGKDPSKRLFQFYLAIGLAISIITPSHVHHSYTYILYIYTYISLNRQCWILPCSIDMIQRSSRTSGISQVVACYPSWIPAFSYPRIGVLWWKSLKIALRNSMNFWMFLWSDDLIFMWI